MKGLKIVIAGGSGFVGQAMASRWCTHNEVVVLSRQQASTNNNSYGFQQRVDGVRSVQWDGRNPGPWTTELEGADLLINLAGRSVNCRYTTANKAMIKSSRVDATLVLGQAIRQCKKPPRLWINGGSATIYRHATDRPQDETTGEIHDDFSVQVCKAWEQAFNDLTLPGTRKIILRMAIVLGQDGALVPYTRLVKFGLGGPQGSGTQMFSWIHIDDLCQIVEWAWADKRAEGIYNAAAPGPVTNAAFMQALRQELKMPVGLPAPGWLLKTGATLIGTEAELLLKSRWVIPTALLQQGFQFHYPQLKAALHSLLRP